jgi:hypothetical protein
MISKFDQVKSIHERAVETGDASVLREIPAMLNRWGIKCREKDGQLLWTNLSVPMSVGESITIGLRYRKKDQTPTEDIFELNRNNPEVVTSYYKGQYQTVRPEGNNRGQTTIKSSENGKTWSVPDIRLMLAREPTKGV